MSKNPRLEEKEYYEEQIKSSVKNIKDLLLEYRNSKEEYSDREMRDLIYEIWMWKDDIDRYYRELVWVY